MQESLDGIRVIRAWAYVSKHRGFYHRLLNYFSFAFLAIWLGIWRAGQQNTIVVESPPLFLGISGVLLSWWMRAPMILNVSDLWPESAISMGILHNRILIRMAVWLENYLYRHSYAVTGQTQGIVDNIRGRLPRLSVELITNGVNPERFVVAEGERSAIRSRFDAGEHFVIGYTGLHGLAQGLQTLLEAAEQLRVHSGILFVFIGDGPDKERLMAYAAQRRLGNVRFFPPEPVEKMPAILSALDAAIVPLKDLPIFQAALPAKLFECMAAGLPIVLSAGGEARDLVERAKGGICVPQENASAMAEAIVQLAHDRELASSLGKNAASYVRIHYDRRKIAERFAQLLPGNKQVLTSMRTT
jgi:glycosyltransferase involved in cell wall biosynthesis